MPITPDSPGTIRIYRAISVAEFDDLADNYEFRTARNTLEGKQFGFSLEDVRRFINDSFFMEGEQAIISALIPIEYTNNRENFEIMDSIDNLQFENGTLTVQLAGLPDLNAVIDDLTLEDVILL